MITFMRVDDRIIHGQIITRWSKEYPCDGIIAVNDKAATTPVLKQSFVAERAGIPPELFSRSLKGERKIPADEFVAICSVLSLDIRDFQENREPATQTA